MSSRDPNLDCVQRVDAAAYALGALDEPEAYREHLATCTTCQQEVAELQAVVDTLPTTVPQARAPKALVDRVFARARAEAELLNAAGPEADRPPRRPNRWRSRPMALTPPCAPAPCAWAAPLVVHCGLPAQPRVSLTWLATRTRGSYASL